MERVRPELTSLEKHINIAIAGIAETMSLLETEMMFLPSRVPVVYCTKCVQLFIRISITE